MKMNKKIISALLVSGLFVSSASALELTNIDTAKDAFCIKADGVYLTSENYVYNNVLYVPLRDVAESLGAEVTWNEESRTIEITTGKEKSSKYNGEYFNKRVEAYTQLPAYFNSVKILIDSKELEDSAFIANDKTYVPINTIEKISSHIYLDQTTSSIRFYSPSYNTDGSFMTYGDKKVNKDDFMDILDFVYQGNPSGVLSDGFSTLDNYLLSNNALVNVASKSGIDMSEKTLNEFYKENSIADVSPVETLEDTDGVKEHILKYYYAYKNIGENVATLYTPTDEDLKKIFDTIPYATQTTLKAQHILISKDENGEGLEKIEELLKEAKKKDTDFTELMLKNSEDPGSQTQPEGYIFAEGEMVPEFYEAALNTPVGEISDVFESAYGYHILKKVAHWENGIPMDEIKDQLIASYSSLTLDENIKNEIINSDVWYNTKEATNEIVKILIEQQAKQEQSEDDKS